MSGFWNGFYKEAWDIASARKATTGVKGLIRRGMHLDPSAGRIAPRAPGVMGNQLGPIITPAPVPKQFPRMQRAVASQAPTVAKAPPGTIFAEGDIIRNKQMQQLGIFPKNLTGPNKEMLNRTVLKHELSERKWSRKGSPEERFYTHFSPNVITEESNMLATLPQEHKIIAEPFKKIRGMDISKNVLEVAMPGFQYGQTRLTRHGKKHMERLIKEKNLMGAQIPHFEAGLKEQGLFNPPSGRTRLLERMRGLWGKLRPATSS